MKNNPIKQLYHVIFQKIDEAKSHPNYEKFKDLLGQIDEEYKEPAKIISTLLFFCIPLIIIFIFLGINNSLRSDIQVKKDIIKYAGEILGNNEMVEKTSKGVLATAAITSFSALNSQVGQVASSAGIDLSKIKLNDFQNESISQTVTKAQAQILLTDITTTQLGSFINNLTVRQKMKISAISFKRDNTKKLITGTLTINHFGKNAQTEEE